MWQFIWKGGALMAPLLLCSVIGTALILDRFYHYVRAGWKARSFREEFERLIRDGRFHDAAALARRRPGPVAAVALTALERIGEGRRRCEEAVLRVGSVELGRLERYLPGLALLARITPLLGLLGTVTGMIRVFMSIEAAGGVTNVTLLAGGLWEAMLTTAAGLIVAVPALAASHLFESAADRVEAGMKEAVSLVLEAKAESSAAGPVEIPATVEDLYGV